MTRIFISHSHSDEAIAYKLVTFLLAALRLEDEDILCTSNPDQGLSYGSSSITDQLKNQLKNSEALIVLITADSLHSAWIPFEAGSFWTTDKTIIPILGPGLTQNDLSGPLKSFLSIPIEVEDAEDKLNNAINQLVKNLNLQQKVNKRRNNTLREFANSLRAWQSKRPAIDLSQQEEIEELKAQIQELDQSYNKQLEEIEATSQKEKKKRRQLNRRQFLKLAGCGGASLVTVVVASKIFPSSPKLQSSTFKVITVDSKATITNLSSHEAEFFEEDLGNGVTLKMVSIPGGKFLMGTEDEEIERLVKKFDREGFKREKPQHEVTVQHFFMGKFQITQAQWQAIASLPKVKQDLKPDPSHFKGENNLPVEQVSWDEAVEFCERLSNLTKKDYRLPTEAEWEYACRSVITHQSSVNSEELTVEKWNEKYHQPFYFGETITSHLANYAGSSIYASEPKGEYRKKTTAVGSFTPNAFGLYDMHGNVWEWCQDDWHENYAGAPVDGTAWLSSNGNIKVIRGGSWVYNPYYSRSACRDLNSRDDRFNSVGFRVVCVAPRTT
ncbi:MAG: SUMF1/EgtB/PvdO family nonheme iron enzyme [Xenococcus sp. MO_188.B8]|nr:SUMF1/EgtB/PvdO family nonheme iron enzyme [Xenococcus sp. MO_188.B8]